MVSRLGDHPWIREGEVSTILASIGAATRNPVIQAGELDSLPRSHFLRHGTQVAIGDIIGVWSGNHCFNVARGITVNPVSAEVGRAIMPGRWRPPAAQRSSSLGEGIRLDLTRQRMKKSLNIAW